MDIVATSVIESENTYTGFARKVLNCVLNTEVGRNEKIAWTVT